MLVSAARNSSCSPSRIVPWDLEQIASGRAELDRAIALRGSGTFVLQAAIASLHLEPQRDWIQIAALYDELSARADSAVIQLNRAIAIAEAYGPRAGLALLEPLPLEDYRYLHSARAEMLRRLEQFDEAGREYARAIALTDDPAERRLLERRSAALRRDSP